MMLILIKSGRLVGERSFGAWFTGIAASYRMCARNDVCLSAAANAKSMAVQFCKRWPR